MTGSEGAVFQSDAQGQQRSTEPQVSATDHEADKFSNQLTDRLREGRFNNEFEHLILVAPPEFLGILRAAMDQETQRCVAYEVNRDLSKHSLSEIADIISRS